MYQAIPSQSDVRKLFNDSNWYQGPPTFGVLPLDRGRASMSTKFTVQLSYIHVGTAEDMNVLYSVFDTSAAATTLMTNLQAQLGQSPSSPRVGDQVLYYGAGSGNGAAPYLSHTFVRVGQFVVEIDLTRKDAQASVNQLASYARKFIAGVQNLGKSRPSPRPSPVNTKQLPPPGRDITQLGSAQLPIEAFVVMIGTALPDNVDAYMRHGGVTTFSYGDYALNADTHMEVRTAFLTFGTPVDAATWASTFGPGMPDSSGLYSQYVSTGGSPAAGEYHYVFTQGQYGVFMICKPAVDGEAASRECEAPMGRTADGWTLALQGVG